MPIMNLDFPGIDIVHVSSFKDQLGVPGSTFQNVFSPMELRIAAGKPNRAQHLAGRWAAKEAFIKAWSQSLYGKPPVLAEDDVRWSEIQVTPDQWGRTVIVLNGEISRVCPFQTIQVSISHDGDYAIAMCTVTINR